MVKFTNALVKTGVKEEATYGTAPASFDWVGLVQENTLDSEKVIENSRSQNGDRQTTQLDIMQTLYSGKLSHKVQDGSMFLAAMGSLSTSGAGPYVHTFSTGQSLISFSVFKEIIGRSPQASKIQIFKGNKINKFTLKAQEKGILMADTEVKGNGVETTTTKAITASTSALFRFADLVNSKISINGNDVRVIGFEWSRTNTLSEDQDGDTIAEPNAQEAVDTLSATLRLEDDIVPALKDAGTEHDVIIIFDKGASNKIQITATGIIKTCPVETGVEGGIEVKVDWEIKSSELEVTDSNVTWTL